MKISLTFDIERDIPNFLDTYYGIEEGLIKILKLLDQFNIKATFFCTGKVVEEFPEKIQLIEKKGHEIGCHSLNHQRLNQINFKECQEIIKKNRTLIEETCSKSKIIGFRAPYLKPPDYLFKILANLDFRYDSSIYSDVNLEKFYRYDKNIKELHPSKYSIYFRLPYPFLERKIFRSELLILYFHPWELIDMKKIIIHHENKSEKIKNLIFRPDRWYKTGDSFIKSIKKFIRQSLALNAEFIPLEKLVI